MRTRFQCAAIGLLVTALSIASRFILFGHENNDPYSSESVKRMVTIIRADPLLTDVSKNRQIAEILFDFDQRELFVAKSNPESLLAHIGFREEKWRDWPPDQAIKIFVIAAKYLLLGSEGMPKLESSIGQFSSNAVNLMPQASVAAADSVASLLTREMLLPSGMERCLSDFIDRERVLDVLLTQQQRMDDFIRVPLDEHTRPFKERRSPKYLVGGDQTPRSLAHHAKLIENQESFAHQEYQWKHLTATNRGPSRLEATRCELAEFVEKRFATNAVDLRIVRNSLDRNIADPTLRDRLIRVVYHGQNPFLTLSADSATGASGPSLEGLTKHSGDGKSSDVAIGNSHNNSVSTSSTVAIHAPPDTTPHGIPYLRLAGVFGIGWALWWFIARSRVG